MQTKQLLLLKLKIIKTSEEKYMYFRIKTNNEPVKNTLCNPPPWPPYYTCPMSSQNEYFFLLPLDPQSTRILKIYFL